MATQDNTKSVDKEEVLDDVNKLYLVYNSYIRSKLEEFPKRVSLERFREIFHELWKKNSKTCENMYNVLVSVVTKSSLEEIEELNESFGMKNKLKILSEICSEYSNSEGVVKWRPNGNVEETLRSHDMQEILKRKNLLEKLVNDELKKIELIKSQLDKNCVKIREAAEVVEKAIKEHERKLSEREKSQEILSAELKKL